MILFCFLGKICFERILLRVEKRRMRCLVVIIRSRDYVKWIFDFVILNEWEILLFS